MGSSGTRDKDGLTELSHPEAKELGFYTLEFVVGLQPPLDTSQAFLDRGAPVDKEQVFRGGWSCKPLVTSSQQRSDKTAGLGKDLGSTTKASTIPLKQKMMEGFTPRKDYANLYLKPISSYFINKSIWTSCSLLNRWEIARESAETLKGKCTCRTQKEAGIPNSIAVWNFVV